ncbi:MAG: hypothetical protein ABI905_12775 [Betaproteobacteria bacterium]
MNSGEFYRAGVKKIRHANALAMLATLLMFGAGAGAFTPINAPITVIVVPSTALVKSKVTISGSTLVVGKNNQVSISISAAGAGGKAVELKATVDASGAFKTDYTATAEGKYKIAVTAPDGKGKAEATLTIASPVAAASTSSAAAPSLIKTMQSGQAAGDAQIAALPPSPAKEEFQKKSAALKQKLAEVPAAQKQYENALGKFYELGNKYPETLPALKPLFDQIDQANEAIKNQNAEFEKRLAQAGKKNATCDTLEAATEAFSALSTSMNMIGKPWEILRAFAIDKGPGKIIDAFPNAKGSDTAKFAITETFKTSAGILVGGAAGGPIAIATTVIGLAGDTAQFFTQQRFAKYCEKFEGPVYAQFRAEMRDKGKPYFTYKLDMRGKLQLRYAKDASIKAGQPIPLTGQIEGVVEKFEMSEDAIIMQPQLKSRVMLHKIISPIGTPYLEDVGTFARMAMPHSFYIPVKGELAGDKITLNLEPATKDFADLIKGKILYVFVEPALPIPSIQTVDAPVQKAFFIFDRGMRAKPEFEVKTDSSKSTIDKTFTRTVEDPAADFKIEWKIEAKACNPACLPSLYFSKGN